VASELPERARGVDVEVTHLAVTREQIEVWGLPTRGDDELSRFRPMMVPKSDWPGTTGFG
jgi:hypothetical protein